MRQSTKVTLWIVSILLGLFFTAAGLAKFISPALADQFAHWGFANWFRVVIGILEMSGGLMLLAPRLAWRGALVLGLVMLGAAITLWWHDETMQALVPSTLLLVTSMVGYAHHPRATLMRRLRHAVDWVAERELEEQRRKLAVHEAMKALKRPVGRRKQRLAKEAH